MKLSIVLMLVGITSMPLSAMAVENCAGVTAKYQGTSRYALWGKERSAASFEVINDGKQKVSLAVESKTVPLLAHGGFFELQARPGASSAQWESYKPALEHHLPPDAWITMAKNGGAVVNLLIDRALSDPKRGALRFRASFEFDNGCKVVSDAFAL
ncbi:hypothetical protein M2650_01840 [Luteimonas sp. SX5]|uniref:Copper chaperone PCu(A)C n=1 Tax=Luteimonas galliterrae TaxID=2940486 RepID=A0ABT0MEU3_9GAMM|nr:hypothetical protein [Luteimonas galliterrae]MCL1633389.1 hypothetical protein [Luteimonas galliterrae]